MRENDLEPLDQVAKIINEFRGKVTCLIDKEHAKNVELNNVSCYKKSYRRSVSGIQKFLRQLFFVRGLMKVDFMIQNTIEDLSLSVDNVSFRDSMRALLPTNKKRKK